MTPIAIDTRADYDYCVSQGFEPLIDRRFKMAIGLRVSVQRKMFGTGHTPAENEKFYQWCWAHNVTICEECMKPLRQYSATFVSHILTRGAYPEMAHDPRNVNILCFDHHNTWENGNRESMRIYAKNQITIDLLKSEYERELHGIGTAFHPERF